MRVSLSFHKPLLGLVMAFAVTSPAWALFGDDEARKAIIELRQLVEEHRRVNAEGAAVTRRSILDVSTQAEQWRQELGQLRGQQEQLLQENQQLNKTVLELKAQLSALDASLATLNDRIKTFEPITVEQDGAKLLVSPAEKTSFDQAMGLLRSSNFAPSAAAFVQILNQYPSSPYTASVLYWLGNVQYASQDLKASVNTHKRMVDQFPFHARVPEALLSMGNAHQELGDVKAARSEWDSLVKNHPKSEAASTASERLKQLPIR
ncbi:MAG: tetratricopeptide repeat protein [Hydrogenophaga sp.]